MHTRDMIRTHPHVQGQVNDALVQCIEDCYDCAQSCTSCADACLGESMVQELTQCIRLNLDCADICAAAGAVFTRRTGSHEELIMTMLQACAMACSHCALECERHADQHEHCRICAEACRRCEDSCMQSMGSLERHH